MKKGVWLIEIITLPDLNNWFKKIDGLCWKLYKLKIGQQVVLDMQKTIFIRPSGAMMVLLLCIEIYNRTGERVRLDNLKADVLAYLERIDLFKFNIVYTDSRLSIWRKMNRGNKSLSVIEITEIKDPSDVNAFRKRSQEIIQRWFSDEDLKSDCDKISTIIFELCNNSLEHSTGTQEMGTCYGILQVYKHQNGPEITLTIGDLGIGIRNHLKIKHSWVYNSDAITIKKVLNGLSGRLDGSGGIGLPTVKHRTRELNGNLYIRSGRAVVGLEDELRVAEFDGSFPGMQSHIVIRKS